MVAHAAGLLAHPDAVPLLHLEDQLRALVLGHQLRIGAHAVVRLRHERDEHVEQHNLRRAVGTRERGAVWEGRGRGTDAAGMQCVAPPALVAVGACVVESACLTRLS